MKINFQFLQRSRKILARVSDKKQVMQGDNWRNEMLKQIHPTVRIDRNESVEKNWADYHQWSPWTTQFLPPLPKTIKIKGATPRNKSDPNDGIKLPNTLPSCAGVYEIRSVRLKFTVEQGKLIEKEIREPSVLYGGKTRILDKNWVSYRGNPNAKGSRKQRHQISEELDFSVKVNKKIVKCRAVQVRWKEINPLFYGLEESLLLNSYAYQWNVQDQ